VNAYRRLDPHFEAPNQIKASATDRGSMVRVPIGNSRSMRVEVRSVAPDANPYLTLYSIFKTGIDGTKAEIDNLRQAQRYLPDNIQSAIDDFKSFPVDRQDSRRRRAGPVRRSQASCGQPLTARAGNLCEGSEVQYHHEIYNQSLWNHF
jgi:glutamine synthetase